MSGVVCAAIRHFNPLPRKEGDQNTLYNTGTFFDFNPLPRKEGDLFDLMAHRETGISIHSLVKRETQTSRKSPQAGWISIHSLVKRETANIAKIQLKS